MIWTTGGRKKVIGFSQAIIRILSGGCGPGLWKAILGNYLHGQPAKLGRETGKLLRMKGASASEGQVMRLTCTFAFTAVSKWHFFGSRRGNSLILYECRGVPKHSQREKIHGRCTLEQMKQLAKGPNEARKMHRAVTGPGQCAIKYLAPGWTGADMQN